jgi:hypothetical protein
MRFHLLLGRACFGLASPVTIQDSSFKSSVLATSRQYWIIGPLVGMLGVVGIVLLTMPILVDPLPSRGVRLPLIFGWLGLLHVVGYRVLRRLGVVSRNWSAEQVAKHLDAVRRGQRLLGHGVEVLKVARTGDEWKLVIREALARADLAIIDVSDVTDPIIWEIDQALRQLHRDRILLVAEERSVRAHALRKRLADEGITASTQYWIERASLFYPAPGKYESWDFAKQTRDFVKQTRDFENRLRREIAWRVNGPSVRGAATHRPAPEVPPVRYNRVR